MAAAGAAADRRPRSPGYRAGTIPHPARGAVGRAGEGRPAGDRGDRAQARRFGNRAADTPGAADRGVGHPGADQQGDCRPALPEPAHRRLPPAEGLHQAGHRLARRADTRRPAARRARLTGPNPLSPMALTGDITDATVAPRREREHMRTSAGGPASGTSAARIMIIDDHEISRAACRALLRTEGIDVVADLRARDDVLAAAGALPPDVAIIDVTPGIDTGFAIGRRLRALPAPPLVVFT